MKIQRYKEKDKTIKAIQNTGDNLNDLVEFYALTGDTTVPTYDDNKNLVNGDYEICLKGDWLIMNEFDELFTEDSEVFPVLWEKI